jgi:hypothetical protein
MAVITFPHPEWDLDDDIDDDEREYEDEPAVPLTTPGEN